MIYFRRARISSQEGHSSSRQHIQPAEAIAEHISCREESCRPRERAVAC